MKKKSARYAVWYICMHYLLHLILFFQFVTVFARSSTFMAGVITAFWNLRIFSDLFPVSWNKQGEKLEKPHIDKTFLKEDLTSALERNKGSIAKLRRYLCGIDIPAFSKQEDVYFHIQTTSEVFVCGGMFYVLLLFLVFG